MFGSKKHICYSNRKKVADIEDKTVKIQSKPMENKSSDTRCIDSGERATENGRCMMR